MAERTLPWWRKVLDYAISGIRSFLRPTKPDAVHSNTSPAPAEEPLEEKSELMQSSPKVEAAAAAQEKVEEPAPALEVQIDPIPTPVLASVPTSEPEPESEPEPQPEPLALGEVAMEPVQEAVIAPEPEPVATSSFSAPEPPISAEPEVPVLVHEPQEAAENLVAEEILKGHDLPGSPATGLRRWGGFSRADGPEEMSGALAPEAEPPETSHQIPEFAPAPQPDPLDAEVAMQIEPAATTIDHEPEPVAEMDAAVEEAPAEIAEAPEEAALIADEPALKAAEPLALEPVEVHSEPEPETAPIETEPVVEEPRVEEISEEHDSSPADTPPILSAASAPEEQALPTPHQTVESEPQEPETPAEAVSPGPVVEPEELPQVEPVEQATEPAENPIDSSIDARADVPIAEEALAAPEQPAAQMEPDPVPQPEVAAADAEAQPASREEAEPEAPKLNVPPAPAPKTEAELKTAARITAAIKAREEGPDPSPFSILVDQVYDGPLDLLLDLIRKQDIDIYDIPISKITAQFLAYVNQLKAGDVDVAGEFIYTASLLIHIKSKMLLPRTESGPDEAAEDPRRELVERLLEHERFKNAAQMLQQKQILEAATWSNPGVREFQDDVAAEPEIAADTVDLVRIFRDILERARNRPVLNVQEDSVTVGQMIQFLTRRLTMEDKPVALSKLLANTRSERALIAMFLALLELVRMQAILLRQDRHFTDIFIKKNTGFDAVVDQGLANAHDDWR